MSKTILAIDIGSTKICAAIAEMKDARLCVRGVGIQKSEGIKKGLIVNMEQASRSIRAAVADASRISNCKCERAIISISSAYTKSTTARGIISISANEEITIEKINKVINNAIYNAAIPTDLEKIQVLPFAFRLDDALIEDPIGMRGQKLEVSVHIVAANRYGVENLRKVVRNAGIEIENIVLASYASALAVLSEGEKELGVACVDMGGNTCELMIYHGNSMCYNYHHPVGSANLNIDLATVLNTNPHIAETLKKQHVDLLGRNEADDATEVIKVPTINGESENEISHREVNEIAKMRVAETLGILLKALENSHLKQNLGAGVVLTGGMTGLNGMLELAEIVFANMPVRIARPAVLDGLSEEIREPSSASIVGLLLYGAGKYTNYEMDSNEKIRYKKPVAEFVEEAAPMDLSELEISGHYARSGTRGADSSGGHLGERVSDIFVEKKSSWLDRALQKAKGWF